MIPEARMGDSAFPENIPKKNMATRLASSFCRYHVDSVYTAPGIYADSASPRKLLTMRKPVRLRTKTCSVATRPKEMTCPDIHLRGPTCGLLLTLNLASLKCDGHACVSTLWSSMLHGISNTTIKRNISWFPRLIVAWFTPMSVAKPAVRALAKFILSS